MPQGDDERVTTVKLSLDEEIKKNRGEDDLFRNVTESLCTTFTPSWHFAFRLDFFCMLCFQGNIIFLLNRVYLLG